MLDPTPLARGLAGKKVEVVNYPDGRFAIRFDGTTLPFRVFDKIRTVRTWRDRGEQTAGRGAGVGEAAAGRVRAAQRRQIRRGNDRRTIWRRRACRRRAGHPAAVSLRRADPVNRSVISIVQRYVTEKGMPKGRGPEGEIPLSKARRPRTPCRPSLILTSTRSLRSSRPAVTVATDETQWFGRFARLLDGAGWATASRAALRAPASAGFGP